MTLNSNQINFIIIARGTGHTQQEISDKLNISRKTVENTLRRLKIECEDNGVYKTFTNHIDIKEILLETLKEDCIITPI